MVILRKYWLEILLFFLALLMPFIWLWGDYTYISEEDNFGNYKNIIYRNLFSWSSTLNKGNAVLPGDHVTIVPNGLVYFILSHYGIPNHTIQKIFLLTIIAITFFSIRYLLGQFTKNKVLILIGVFFYYFNFYVKSTIFYTAKMYQLILLPLLFVYFYKYLETKQNKYIFLNFIVFFLTQAIFTNLASALATIIIYPIALAYFIIQKNYTIIDFIKHYGIRTLLFFLPLGAIFFYNALVFYYSYISSTTFKAIKTVHTFTALSSPLNLIFQQRGAWWETASFDGVQYNPWLWFYENPFIVFGSFFLIGVTIFTIYKTKSSKTLYFWIGLFLISILLASGSSFYPLIYKLLYNNVPLFYIFREPWAKFTPLLIFFFSILLVLSLEKLNKKLIVYLCLFFVVIRALPFFSPNFFDHNSKRWHMPFIKLPYYWIEYEKWTLKNTDKTILSIPLNYFKRNWYKEDIGNANHPISRLYGYSDVIYNIENNYFGSLLRYFTEHRNPYFVKLAGVDYALVQKDVDLDFSQYPLKDQKLNSLLQKQFLDKPTVSFGNKLFLYEINQKYKTHRLYIPRYTQSTASYDGLATIVSNPEYDKETATFLKAQNVGKVHVINQYISLDRRSKDNISLDYEQINPTVYRVRIQNAKDIIPLILTQNYHPDWNLYAIRNPPFDLFGMFWRKPISTNSHFIANGYANSWFIDPHSLCKNTKTCQLHDDGSYSINFTIEYGPQQIFYYGVSIYFVLLMVTFSYFGINLAKRVVKINHNQKYYDNR